MKNFKLAVDVLKKVVKALKKSDIEMDLGWVMADESSIEMENPRYETTFLVEELTEEILEEMTHPSNYVYVGPTKGMDPEIIKAVNRADYDVLGELYSDVYLEDTGLFLKSQRSDWRKIQRKYPELVRLVDTKGDSLVVY